MVNKFSHGTVAGKLAMTWVAGLDGCRGGWVVARLETRGRTLRIELAETWAHFDPAGIALAAVDMPIGLAESGPRPCDLAARALLPRGRKSSVFPSPRRYMLDCPDWPAAHALGRRREGKGLSKETWNITGKIAEIDRAIRPADQDRLFEVHPELLFHHLNAWRPLPGKTRPGGREARREILARCGLTLPERLPAAFRGAARLDDLLDAAACALVAERILKGTARRLPDNPPLDSRGLRMEIWY